MNESHINDVYELSKECFSIPWSLDAISNELENTLAHYVVAEDLSTNKVIGFVGVWIIVGDGNITNIAVNPNYRNKSIASNLLINLFELCKNNNCSDITLEVRASNISAQNLYSKFGFIQEGLRKRYYEDNNEDAIILWKRDI